MYPQEHTAAPAEFIISPHNIFSTFIFNPPNPWTGLCITGMACSVWMWISFFLMDTCFYFKVCVVCPFTSFVSDSGILITGWSITSQIFFSLSISFAPNLGKRQYINIFAVDSELTMISFILYTVTQTGNMQCFSGPFSEDKSKNHPPFNAAHETDSTVFPQKCFPSVCFVLFLYCRYTSVSEKYDIIYIVCITASAGQVTHWYDCS